MHTHTYIYIHTYIRNYIYKERAMERDMFIMHACLNAHVF